MKNAAGAVRPSEDNPLVAGVRSGLQADGETSRLLWHQRSVEQRGVRDREKAIAAIARACLVCVLRPPGS